MNKPIGVVLKDFYGRYGKKLWTLVVILLLLFWFYIIYIQDEAKSYQYLESDQLLFEFARNIKLVGSFPKPDKPNLGALKTNSQVIIDISGSMNQSDPTRLALESAKMFIDLLNDESYVSVILFNHGLALDSAFYKITKDKEKTEKDEIKKQLDVFYEGGTNIDLALNKGFEKAIKQKQVSKNVNFNYKDIIVFFTDAQVTSVQDVRQKLKDNDITLFPIGFGPAYYTNIFQYMSYENPYYVKNADDLPQTYASIYSKIFNTKPYTPTKTDVGYEIISNKNIPQLNLIAIYDDTTNLQYKLYKGDKEIDLNNDPDIYTSLTKKYLVIKIKNNSWDKKYYFKSLLVPKSIIVIPVYNFFISVDFSDLDLITKEVQVKSISVIDSFGNIINDPSINFYVYLDGPNKRTIKKIENKIADGVYSGSFKFDEAGDYKFYFVAESPGYIIESTSYNCEFAETYNLKATNSNYDVNYIRPGVKLKIPIFIKSSGYLGNVGETLFFKEKEQIYGLKLLTDNLTFSNNNPQNFLEIELKKGKYPFIKGCNPGKKQYVLNLSNSSVSFDININLNIVDLPFFEKYKYLILTLILYAIALFIVLRLIKYIPFDTRLTMIRYSQGMINYRTISHPGNNWLFGKAELKIGKDCVIVPVSSNKETLCLIKKNKVKSKEKDKDILDINKEYYYVDNQVIYDGDGFIFFTKSRKRNYRELSLKFESLLKKLKNRYGKNFDIRIEDF